MRNKTTKQNTCPLNKCFRLYLGKIVILCVATSKCACFCWSWILPIVTISRFNADEVKWILFKIMESFHSYLNQTNQFHWILYSSDSQPRCPKETARVMQEIIRKKYIIYVYVQLNWPAFHTVSKLRWYHHYFAIYTFCDVSVGYAMRLFACKVPWPNTSLETLL